MSLPLEVVRLPHDTINQTMQKTVSLGYFKDMKRGVLTALCLRFLKKVLRGLVLYDAGCIAMVTRWHNQKASSCIYSG